jgi:hypothetical protein
MFLTQKHFVIQEIDKVLADYPEHPYQAAFSIEELRQKLVTHVLKHIPAECKVTEIEQKQQKKPNSLLTKEQRLRIDVLIRGSILHLLRENADWISHRIHQENN